MRLKPGYAQSREHIRLIEEKGYSLRTFPMTHSNAKKDSKGHGPAKIGDFTAKLSPPRFLIKSGQNWYASSAPAQRSTEVGYINRNGQEVMRPTGFRGTDHRQSIYILACRHCGNRYGANGSDVHLRKCPRCQNGQPGLETFEGIEPQNARALIIAYYLSKFDQQAYSHLNFGNATETHREIGRRLGVKERTIQGMRDEFDPLHGHRAGWHKRSLSPSRRRTAELLQNLSEGELFLIAQSFLQPQSSGVEALSNIIDATQTPPTNKTGPIIFAPRGPTARKAEQLFLDKCPLEGRIIDKREYGCGYDFEVINGTKHIFVEVKGLDGDSGGIGFTGKEWEIAKEKRGDYFLVIFRNVHATPSHQVIPDPATALQATMRTYTVVQTQWAVGDRELKDHRG